MIFPINGKRFKWRQLWKKYLIVDKFSKVTYINDQKIFLESGLYIEPEGVIHKKIYKKYNFLKSKKYLNYLINH